MMITNAVLGGIADTVAQSITTIRLAAMRKPGGITKDDTMAIEIGELDRKNQLNSTELIPDSKFLPPPFDFERLTRFMAYGFMMAPIQFRWFKFLSKTFPITKTSGTLPAMQMMAFDQLIFAPVGMILCCSGKACEVDVDRMLSLNRDCYFFHGHDCCGGRWKESCYTQTTGYVSPNAESELHGLASGADSQFPPHAYPIPTCKSSIEPPFPCSFC